jgi:hypothetical protein
VWRSLRHKSTYSTVSDEEQTGTIDPKLAFSLHTPYHGSISPASVRASSLAYNDSSVLIVE